MLYSFFLLSPSFTSLYWTITVAIHAKNNSRSQNVWIAAGVVLTISTFVWGICFGGVSDYATFYKLELLEAVSTMLLPVMFFVCFRSLTNEKPFGWKVYAWLAPAFVMGAAMLALYISMGDARATAYVRSAIEHRGDPPGLSGEEYVLHFISGPVYSLLVLGELVFVLIYGTISLARYRHRLDDFFSNLRGKSTENARTLLICGYAMMLLSLAPYKGRFYYNEPSAFLAVLMACWSVAIYLMGYNVYKLKYSAGTLASELEDADRKARLQPSSDLPDQNDAAAIDPQTIKQYAALGERFERLLDEKQIFMQVDLRLNDVAQMMRTNRTYISRMINQQYGRSFSDVINRRRIEAAQRVILAEPDLSLGQLAERSGFSDASYLSRMFRRHTGMTLREWQRRNRYK